MVTHMSNSENPCVMQMWLEQGWMSGSQPGTNISRKIEKLVKT